MTTLYASGATSNTASNWGLTTGASDGSVPIAGDIVIFDVNSISMAIDANFACASIDTTGYTATLTQSTFTITLTGGFTCPAGTFIGGSGTLTVGGTFLLNGGAFTAPSGTFNSNSTFTISSGSYTHNSGKIRWGRSQTVTTNGSSFYDVDFVKTIGGNINTTLADDFTIVGDLFVDNTNANAYAVNPSGTRIITLKGNVTMSETGTGTATLGNINLTVLMDGGGTQTLTQTEVTGRFQATIDINTAGTIQLATAFIFDGSFTYNAGTFDQNGFPAHFGGIVADTQITSNGLAYDDVSIIKGTTSNRNIFIVDDMTINGDLVLGGGINIWGILPTGTRIINLKGNLSMSTTGTLSFGNVNLTFKMNGSGTQTITHDGTNANIIAQFEIDTAGTVQFLTDVPFTGNFTYTSGTFDQNGFDVIFNFRATAVPVITANGLEFDNLSFIKTVAGNRSVTLADDFTINGNLTHTTSGANDCKVNPSGTRVITLKGNLIMEQTAGALHFGSTSLTLKMADTNAQTISWLQGRFSSLLLIDKASNNVTLVTDFEQYSTPPDVTIENGTLVLGAFNFKVGDLFTMNNASTVTSTTGIFTSQRFDLNGTAQFDPFKAISSSTTPSVFLFTDEAGVNLMPSGGDFEFTGSNHWWINQVFTEFPHLIFNKCPTCDQAGAGQWYAQDVTIKNDSKWGTGNIRGNVIIETIGFNGTSTLSIHTFDGTGVQTVTGEITFGDLTFNKVSGTVTFLDNFRFNKCHVTAGANFIDFGTSEGHILATGSHLPAPDWVVLGLEFWSLKLEIATSGNAVMNDTVILNDFELIQASSLDGDLTIGGHITYTEPTLFAHLATILLNGTGDQDITITGGLDNGPKNTFDINKASGRVILRTHFESTEVLFFIHLIAGIMCTNGFNITCETLTVDVGATLQVVSPSIITVNGVETINGSKETVTGCTTGIVV